MSLIDLIKKELEAPTTIERKEELLKRALSALEICRSEACSLTCCADCGVEYFSSCDTTGCINSLSMDVARMRANIRAAIE